MKVFKHEYTLVILLVTSILIRQITCLPCALFKVDLVNQAGKNAVMYAAEAGRYEVQKRFLTSKFNFIQII